MGAAGSVGGAARRDWEHGVTIETLGARVSELERGNWTKSDGPDQWASGGTHEAVCLVVIGVERGEKRFLSIPGIGELARGVTEIKVARDECAGAGDWRRRHGFLGCVGGSVRWDTPATVLDAQDDEHCLPKSLQAKAKQALHAIWQAETKADAEQAFDLFLKTYEPKYREGDVVSAERSRGADGVLRLPGPTLTERTYEQPD